MDHTRYKEIGSINKLLYCCSY